MAQIIKAREAVRSFSDIINRVYYKGESFDIQKGNNIVAKITPVENKSSVKVKNLDELFKNGPCPNWNAAMAHFLIEFEERI